MKAVWKRRGKLWWLVEDHTGNVLASVSREGAVWQGVTEVEGMPFVKNESLQQCMRDCERQIMEAAAGANDTGWVT